MKRIWIVISLLSINIIPISVFSLNINNIFDSVELIKSSIKFEDITIKSEVPYDLVQNAIQKHCPKSAVNQAEKELAPLKEVWVSSLNNPNINKSLSDRFDMVK